MDSYLANQLWAHIVLAPKVVLIFISLYLLRTVLTLSRVPAQWRRVRSPLPSELEGQARGVQHRHRRSQQQV